MSTQVVRIADYNAGSLKNIGNELERAEGVEDRNKDIDKSLSYLNTVYKSSEEGFYRRFKQILKELNCTFTGKKNQTAFEGMIITSDRAFFESLGYEKGKPAPPAVVEFFDKAYAWALSEIGYNKTDKNIIGAQVHYDETTPHLQIYFIPVVDEWREKVYEKSEDGTVKRNDKGSPIQAKDENGKALYKTVKNSDAPKVSKGDFWTAKGGKTSYHEMQNRFFEKFNEEYQYKLERGQIGSTKKHTTKYEWEAQQLEEKNKALIAQNAALIAERDELIKSFPQRPVQPEKPIEPTRDSSFTPEQQRASAEKYKKEMAEYNKALKKYNRDIKNYPKEIEKWQNKYLSAENIELMKADLAAREKEIAQKESEQQAKDKALTQREQQLALDTVKAKNEIAAEQIHATATANKNKELTVAPPSDFTKKMDALRTPQQLRTDPERKAMQNIADKIKKLTERSAKPSTAKAKAKTKTINKGGVDYGDN